MVSDTTASPLLLPPHLSPCERRLISLEENVAYSLADDQAFLADGIIVAYRALASADALLELEKQRRSDIDMSLGAPRVCAELGRRYHHGNCCRDGLTILHALHILNEVNTAIAWCEGKMAVTKRLFPSPVLAGYSQHAGVLSNEEHNRLTMQKMSLDLETNPSNWQVPLESFQYGASQNYYEGPDGKLESRSRSRVWPADTRLSSVPNAATQNEVEDMNTPAVVPSWASVNCNLRGDNIVCNMDFDRWTARQIAFQAQLDKKRLWLFRCVIEEGVRRHALIVEERLSHITFLITAREEMAIKVNLQKQAWMVDSLALREKEMFRVEEWVREQLGAQERLLASAVSALRKGATEFKEACQQQLQKSLIAHCKKKEEKVAEALCNTKETQTFVTGSCMAETAWSSITFVLLWDSERTQRLFIDREAQLAWQLLLAHWQMVLNHINCRHVIAAKEDLIHELAAEANGLSPPVPLRSISPWVVSDREILASEHQHSKSPLPTRTHRMWAIEGAYGRGTSLKPVYIPPVRQPAKPYRFGDTPLTDSSRGWTTQSFSRVPKESAGAGVVSLSDRATASAVSLQTDASESPVMPHSLLKHVSKRHSSDDVDISLNICASVELVERKQVALMEQRAWGGLSARLDREWKRIERRWKSHMPS